LFSKKYVIYLLFVSFRLTKIPAHQLLKHKGYRVKCLIILLLILSFINAQNNDLALLNWDDRKLDWSDFKGTPKPLSPYDSEFQFQIGYSTKTYLKGDLNIYGFVTHSYMDRYLSWADASIRNDQYLLYNQIIFNITELYSRYLQKELSTLKNLVIPEEETASYMLKSFNSKCIHHINKFQIESAYGRNREVLNIWDKKIQNLLQITPKLADPVYALSNHGIGGSFDLGYGLLTDPANKFISNPINIAFGFEYAYRPLPLTFYLRGTLGFNSIKRSFTKENKLWRKDLSTGFALLHFSTGYHLVKTKNCNITPFVGIGLVELGALSTKSRYEDHSLYKSAPIFGLNIDYKFYKSLALIPPREKADFFIRYRLYITPFSIDKNLKGNVINFTIGIGGFTNFLNNS